MKQPIRVVDDVGNHEDHEAELDYIPRIGERVMLEYARRGDAVQPHYFRVKDVLHIWKGAPGRQISLLLDEEASWTGQANTFDRRAYFVEGDHLGQ